MQARQAVDGRDAQVGDGVGAAGEDDAAALLLGREAGAAHRVGAHPARVDAHLAHAAAAAAATDGNAGTAEASIAASRLRVAAQRKLSPVLAIATRNERDPSISPPAQAIVRPGRKTCGPRRSGRRHGSEKRDGGKRIGPL